MSSWQSFFNQLSRPQRTNSHSTSELICQCQKGNLIRNVEMEFIHTGDCAASCFCAIIEMDKRNARKFSNSISILQTENFNIDQNKLTGLNQLKKFLSSLDDVLD